MADSNNPLDSFGNATISGIEASIKALSGESSYKFGDLSRQAIKELSGKEVDEYQFGDITRRVAASAGTSAAAVVSEFTGKEEYQFGDITSKVFSEADKTLSDWRDEYVGNLPRKLWKQAFGDLTAKQQTAVLGALVQFASVAVLSFSLISTLFSGCAVLLSSLTWGRAFSATSSSLATLSLLRLMFDPLTLPLRALLALLLTPRYWVAVDRLQRWLPLRQPALSRALAVVLAFLSVNGLAAGVVAWLALRVMM